jgi:hypothetical protein
MSCIHASERDIISGLQQDGGVTQAVHRRIDTDDKGGAIGEDPEDPSVAAAEFQDFVASRDMRTYVVYFGVEILSDTRRGSFLHPAQVFGGEFFAIVVVRHTVWSPRPCGVSLIYVCE